MLKWYHISCFLEPNLSMAVAKNRWMVPQRVMWYLALLERYDISGLGWFITWLTGQVFLSGVRSCKKYSRTITVHLESDHYSGVAEWKDWHMSKQPIGQNPLNFRKILLSNILLCFCAELVPPLMAQRALPPWQLRKTIGALINQ